MSNMEREIDPISRLPFPSLPVFAGCEVVGGAVAEALFGDGLCLPSGTAMTEADLARVAAVIRRVGR